LSTAPPSTTSVTTIPPPSSSQSRLIPASANHNTLINRKSKLLYQKGSVNIGILLHKQIYHKLLSNSYQQFKQLSSIINKLSNFE
jgi:hypothetical protein